MEPSYEIVRCSGCGARNRVCPHPATLSPICGQCGKSLESHSDEKRRQRHAFQPASVVFLSLFLFAALVAVVCGIAVTPSLMKRDYSELVSQEEQQTQELRRDREQQLASLNDRLQAELAAIDAKALQRNAALYYEGVMGARRSFDQRYALTPREKAQLRMRELASDSARSYHDAIVAIAREAAPKGADISVDESVLETALHIDFDMSSMTSGENGIYTKHHTKESLKKEVVALVSRVTNDLFQFCKGLDLEIIYVGCRHYVRTEDLQGTTTDKKTTLYKVRVCKDRVPELTSNPFLDVYSTTEYLQVDQDNFDQIELITTRL